MLHLLQQIYFVSLAFSAYGELDPYFKELLKIIARKQILQSEEFEMDELDVKEKVEDTKEEHSIIPKDKYLREKEFSDQEKEKIIKSTLEHSSFCVIPYSKEFFATKVKPEDFPWIARVYHSPGIEVPICTAVAIKTNVFTTAARCLATTKVGYMYLHCNLKVFRPRAFVLPDNPTKEMFDDAGFIVVDPLPGFTWSFLEPTSRPRKGKGFFWLDDWPVNSATNKVYGFVKDMFGEDILFSLDAVYVSNQICHKLVRINSSTEAYYVPCLNPCSPEDQALHHPNCDRYISGLGHAVVEESGKLLGLATWTCEHDEYVSKYKLPIGLTIPNSKVFQEDLECAVKISEAEEDKQGRYKNMCRKKKLITKKSDSQGNVGR